MWPLAPETYAGWVGDAWGDVVTLGWDFETFGEHHRLDTGIFKFVRALNTQLKKRKVRMMLPSEAIAELDDPLYEIHVNEYGTTWAGEGGMEFFLGNSAQHGLFRLMHHAYSKARLAFLHALKTWSVFGTGWARRVAGVEAESIRMAYQAQTQAPPVVQPKVERPSSAAYPTPADIAPRKSAPISPASVAAEAAKAQGARAAAQKGAGGAATASGAGSALAPAAGHVHWAVWAVCGGAALAAIAVCLWRWRAHGARFQALSNLA